LAVKQHEVAMRENLDLMHVHYAIPHAAHGVARETDAQGAAGPEDRHPRCTATDITLVGRDPSYYTLTKFSIEQSDPA